MPQPQQQNLLPGETRYGYATVAAAAPPDPTPPPLFRGLARRQAPDGLGWSDTKTCNVGICDRNQWCTVWGGNGFSDSPAVGGCADSTFAYTPYTACIPYSEHTFSINTATAHWTISRSTVFCGYSAPYCAGTYILTGYGLGTLLITKCQAGITELTFTSINPSHLLYAAKSSFNEYDKGPKPTSATTSTPTTGPTETSTATATSSTAPALSAGALAGIAIGGVAVVGLIVVLVVWLILRARRRAPKSSPTPPEIPIDVPDCVLRESYTGATAAQGPKHYTPPDMIGGQGIDYAGGGGVGGHYRRESENSQGIYQPPSDMMGARGIGFAGGGGVGGHYRRESENSQGIYQSPPPVPGIAEMDGNTTQSELADTEVTGSWRGGVSDASGTRTTAGSEPTGGGGWRYPSDAERSDAAWRGSGEAAQGPGWRM